MKEGRQIDNWTYDQRLAVYEEIDEQMVEALSRLVRLSRELVAEIGVAAYLANRRVKHKRDEMDEEPPF